MLYRKFSDNTFYFFIGEPFSSTLKNLNPLSLGNPDSKFIEFRAQFLLEFFKINRYGFLLVASAIQRAHASHNLVSFRTETFCIQTAADFG